MGRYYDNNQDSNFGDHPDWNMVQLLMERLDRNNQMYDDAIKESNYPLAYRLLKGTIWVNALFKIRSFIDDCKEEDDRKKFLGWMAFVEQEFKDIESIIKSGAKVAGINMFVIDQKLYELRKVINELMFVSGLLYPKTKRVSWLDEVKAEYE